MIAAILGEALPADDEMRTFYVVYPAYLALSLTDPALAINPLVRNSNAVINVVAAQLRAAQAAGDTPTRVMPPEVARRGIDFVLANALELGRPEIEIAYHGGGEPTLNWKTLTGSYDYARQRAPDPAVLAAMNESLIHRGPDGHGLHVDGPAGLAARTRPRRGLDARLADPWAPRRG